MSEDITFVGLDVHKESIAVASLVGQAPVADAQVFVMENTPDALKRLAKRLLSNGGAPRACYEAGPCGYAAYRQLTELGVPCEVIAPSLIPKKPGDHVKTDRRDARQLATLYRAGMLTTVRVPTEPEEDLRDLARVRESLRRDTVAVQHQLLKFLLRHGRVFAHGTHWTDRHVRWLRQQQFQGGNARATFEEYLAQWDYLRQRKEAVEAKLIGTAVVEPYAATVRRLCCLRGFETLRAMLLLAEVTDFRRFPEPDSMAGFLGLVPGKDASAGRDPRQPITKAGNSRARRVMVEAAWAYVSRPSLTGRLKPRLEGQPPEVVELSWNSQRRLHGRYEYLRSQGKPAVVAVVAVARELCAVVWAMMQIKPEQQKEEG
jgi:transposase